MYNQSLYKVLDNHIKPKIINRMNRYKKWQYGYNKEQKLKGILKYGNTNLKNLNINEGDLVGFKPNREWQFLVEGKRLYCMESNDIVIKYEHQGNEEEYNPSWASSS